MQGPLVEWVIRAGAFAAVFLALVLWEARAPRRARTTPRSRRWPGNLGVLALDAALVRLLVPAGAIGAALLAGERGWGLLNVVALPRALEIVLAVLIALLINQAGVWTSRITRVLILLPYAIPPICNGLIWAFMYSFQFGFLNRIAFTLGLIDNPVNWAGNPDTALYAVTVPYIWRTLPFAIILVHAALQGIPRELYEQAAVDGARAWQRFRHITLPMLMQIIAVILILRTAFAFAVFEEILAITQGGPGTASETINIFLYLQAFAYYNLGYASAVVVVFFTIIIMLAMVLLWTRARVKDA